MYDLCEEIGKESIIIKEKVIQYYKNQKEIIKQINIIEEKQSKEYIKEREYEVIRLMKLVGDVSLIDSSENQKKN